MSSNRALELVQKLTQLENERDAVRAELGGLLGFSTAAPPTAVSAPAKTKPVQKSAAKPTKTAGNRTVKVKGEDGVERTQPALKQVVQDIVAKHPEGIEARAITDVVIGMIERKEYISNASSVTAVVSQAINQLQTDKAIIGEKSPESKRKKYKRVAVAA